MTFHHSTLERTFQDERGRMLATLIRMVGDFDAAEDALAAAYEAALQQWPTHGTPEIPRAWLLRAARNKAIDEVRKSMNAARKQDELLLANGQADGVAPAPDEVDEPAVGDDVLRLFFTCCHPALCIEAQVALTLRTLGGLSTEQIARAFLVPTVVMSQRLVRAKHKIKNARIPYKVPDAPDLSERVTAVLAVIYLIFNEGYTAPSGETLGAQTLVSESVRLGRCICELMPAHAEARGLLGLMLLQDSRRDARVTAAGELVVLEEQDRSLWHKEQINEGLLLVDQALRLGAAGVYAIQAAIAAVHARAGQAADTDWRQIELLYARLFVLSPSAVVMLNHAVAVAMADGPAAGFALISQLDLSGALPGYYLLPAARADLLRRLQRHDEAKLAYQEALLLVGSEVEKRFLLRRLRDLG